MLEGFDISKLPPEALAALLELGGGDEQKQDLDLQMQQAMALGKPSDVQRGTPVAAALGGLADLLNSGSSRLKQQKIREMQQQLRDKQMSARQDFGHLLGGGSEWENPYGYGGK